MNQVNGMSLGIKAIGKRSLCKLKTDRMCKLRLVDRTSTQQMGIDFRRSFAAVANIGTEQMVLNIVDEYGSPVAQMDVSVPKLCNREDRSSMEQS